MKLLAAVAVLAMVAAAFVVSIDSTDAVDETNAIDITTVYDTNIDNSKLGNILFSTESGITGYVSKITDDTLSTNIEKTWPGMVGKDKTYEYALVFTIDVTQNKYVTFGASDETVKSIQITDGKLTVLKYINSENKNTAFTYAVTDSVQTSMPTAGVESVTIDVELAETVDPTTSAIFKDGGSIVLETNYIFSKTCAISKTATITMNGYDIVGTNKTIFNVSDNAKFTIYGDEDSKVISINVGGSDEGLYSAIHGFGDISLNSGYYEAPYVINLGQKSGFNGNLVVKDAMIVAKNAKHSDGEFYSEGIWASFDGFKKVTIEDTIVNSEGLGIYLGVTAESVLNNVTVASEGTALEIKSGNVKINGGSYTSSSYIASDCTIGTSGSGSGEDTICINNGYSRETTGSKVIVEFSDVSVSNTKTTKPIQIVSGQKEGSKTICTDPITVTGVDLSQIEVKMVNDGQQTVNIKTSETDSTPVVTTTPTTVTTDVIFAVSEDVTGATVAVNDTAKFTVSTGDKTFSGIITIGAGTAAQTVTVDGLKGDVTFFKGSIELSGNYSGEVTDFKGDLVLNGSTDGDLNITTTDKDSTITFGDGFTVAAGHKVIITGVDKTSVKIVDTADVLVDGTMEVKNVNMSISGTLRGNGTLVADADSKVYVDSGAMFTLKTSGNAGSFEIGDAMKEFHISQDVVSNITTNSQQKVYIDKSITIYKGATLSIAGDLEVADGMKITVKDGGKLLIDGINANAHIAGDVIIEGANGLSINAKSVIVDGLINVKADSTTAALVIDSDTEINGEIIIQSKASAQFNGGLIVNENGTLTVNGTIAGNVSKNYGTVVVNGKASNFTVNMQVGGTVDVQSVTGAVTVTDDGMVMKKNEVVLSGNANSLTVSNAKGLKVTSDFTTKVKNDVKTYTNQMYISGTASTIKDVEGAEIAIAKGTVTVSDSLNIGKVDMTIDATLKVAGTVTATEKEDGKITIGNGKLTVTGTVKTYEPIDNEAKIEAVHYTIKENDVTFNIYTNLADAIASGVEDLEVFGDLTISKDTTIPAKVSVEAKAVKVKSDVTFTVADGGELSFSSMTVDGTFIIENRENVSSSNIISDVSSVTETTAMYTNLANALANANADETVTITNKDGTALLSKDAVIKEGVTLEVPFGKVLAINEGVKLTVNGKLFLNNGELAANKVPATGTDSDLTDGKFGTKTEEKTTNNGQTTTVKYAVVAVNGLIETTSELSYDTYKIAGAYYDVKSRSYITTVEKSVDVIMGAESQTVNIYGENTVGTVAFVGTADKDVTVNVNGKITAGSMTVQNGSIVFSKGIVINGTFGTPVGTVVFVNAGTDNSDSLTIRDTLDNDDKEIAEVSGAIIADAKAADDSSVVFNGAVIVKDTTSITLGADDSLIVSFDATVTVSGGLTVTTVVLTVEGSLVISNDATLGADGTVVVMGTMDVAAAISSKAPGSANVGKLFVGISSEDVAASASVNGNVTATQLLVVPGATISGALKDRIDTDNATKSTEFYVEDSLWMTVYVWAATDLSKEETGDGNTRYVKYFFTPSNYDDKKFVAWQYTNNDGKIVNVPAGKSIGDIEKVYASIDYKVYSVTVQVAEGIDDVYIDGVLMTPGVNFVKAGQHTISYTLANGYGGEATMLVNGEKVTGYTFTASGDYEESSYTIILQGIEKTGYTPDAPDNTDNGSDDGMSITDYLLIVLVVLIVIMAILVAIRMMRS